MSNFIRHPYHLVDESPWPLIASLAAFYLTNGLVIWFYNEGILLLILGLIRLIMSAFQWWRDISAEGSIQGLHLGIVELGLRSGIILFIVSEIFFFLSFFWCYFHIRLSPSIDVGSSWVPMGIISLDPLAIPLLNTVVLIVSGISITWSHHALISGQDSEAKQGILLTIILGLLFTILQGAEYIETSFRMADSVYGSVFFIATGFHGLHVIVGRLFLLVTYIRIKRGDFSKDHHFGFEARAWYWHFVDVVWLFLYLCVYWWGRI